MTRTVDTAPLVYTVEDAAKLLRVSRNTLYGLVEQGVIHGVRWGKLIRIPHWSLIQDIAAAANIPVPLELLANGAIPSVHVVDDHDEEDDDHA